MAIKIRIFILVGAVLQFACPSYAENGISVDLFPKPVIQKKVDNIANSKESIRKLAPSVTDNFVNTLTSRIYQNWEPPENRQQDLFKVCFGIDSKGQFHNIKITNPSKDEQENFSCSQAVAEASGCCYVPENTVGVELTLDASLARQKNSECQKMISKYHGTQYVVGHLIPADVLQNNPKLDSAIVHSKQNLRIMDKNALSGKAIESLREDWISLLRVSKPLGKQEILKYAKLLENRYSNLMKKPDE